MGSRHADHLRQVFPPADPANRHSLWPSVSVFEILVPDSHHQQSRIPHHATISMSPSASAIGLAGGFSQGPPPFLAPILWRASRRGPSRSAVAQPPSILTILIAVRCCAILVLAWGSRGIVTGITLYLVWCLIVIVLAGMIPHPLPDYHWVEDPASFPYRRSKFPSDPTTTR